MERLQGANDRNGEHNLADSGGRRTAANNLKMEVILQPESLQQRHRD